MTRICTRSCAGPILPATVFKWCLLSLGPRALVLSCHPPVYLSWTPDAIIYHHIVSCHLCFLFEVSFWRYNIYGNTYFGKKLPISLSLLFYFLSHKSRKCNAYGLGDWKLEPLTIQVLSAYKRPHPTFTFTAHPLLRRKENDGMMICSR